jgi:hypothetical protein
MPMQVQISGDDTEDMRLMAQQHLTEDEWEKLIETRSEAHPDKSKEPFTTLLLILAIDKGIDIIKEIIKERRRQAMQAVYTVSIDGQRKEMTADELLARLDALERSEERNDDE